MRKNGIRKKTSKIRQFVSKKTLRFRVFLCSWGHGYGYVPGSCFGFGSQGMQAEPGSLWRRSLVISRILHSTPARNLSYDCPIQSSPIARAGKGVQSIRHLDCVFCDFAALSHQYPQMIIIGADEHQAGNEDAFEQQ